MSWNPGLITFIGAVIIVVGGLLTGWGQYLQYQQRQAAEELKRNAGKLSNGEKGSSARQNKKMPSKLEIGNSTSILRQAQPGHPLLFNTSGGNVLKIESEDGEMKVSTTLRDSDGSVVAELINNEWQVNHNGSFDRNYTKDALEVRDKSGDVVLQLKLVEDRVQLQGKFYDGREGGLAIYQRGSSGVIGPLGPDVPRIGPLLMYPSALHLG